MKLFNKTKLNNKGFGHIEMLLVLVVVVAVAAAGFLVYQNHNKKGSNVSHAGGQTTLGSYSGVTVYACHTYVGSYGGVNEVTFRFIKAASTPSDLYYVMDVRGTTTVVSEHGNTWLYGTLAQESVNQSVANGDTVNFSLSYVTSTSAKYLGGSVYTVHQVNTWATC